MKKKADERDIFSLPEDSPIVEEKPAVKKKDLGMPEDEYERGRMYANVTIERFGDKLSFVYRVYRYGKPYGFSGTFEQFREKYPQLESREWQAGEKESEYPGYGGAHYKSKEPREESAPEYGRGLEMKILRPRKERWQLPGERGQEGLTFKTTPGLITDPEATPEKHMQNILAPGKTSFFGEGFLPLPKVQSDIGKFRAGQINTMIKKIWAEYLYEAVWKVDAPVTNSKVQNHMKYRIPAVINVFSAFFERLGVDMKDACSKDEHIQNLIEEVQSKKAAASFDLSKFSQQTDEGEEIWIDLFDGQIYGSEQAVIAAKEGREPEKEVPSQEREVELPMSVSNFKKLVVIADKLDKYDTKISDQIDLIIKEADMNVYMGEEGVKNSYQQEFPKSVKCHDEKCDGTADIAFVTQEEGGDSLVCDLHQTDPENDNLWLHDSCAVAVYFCRKCLKTSALGNQA